MDSARPPRRISILGSTGSIGRSALDVVRHYPGLFQVDVLAARASVEVLAAQIREFHPHTVAVSDPLAAARLRAMDLGVTILDGEDGMVCAAQAPVDIVLCAVVGAIGLRPLLAAIDAGNGVAVANKEPFVMAGRLVMEHAAARGVEVLPVDSEHNAIYQCMHGYKKQDVRCIHLTASGGPFYGRDRATLGAVTPAQATKHPTWDMGAKISVDSATLMNKGLEIVEAMWLFGLPEDRIDVVIHPQSVIHSLVEFNDGNILAHLGVTDMKFPILFALTWPERVQSPMARLDLTTLRSLTFAAPDFREFPCLGLARAAAKTGGTATALLNAANEAAVEAFCAGRIPFLAISEVVERVMTSCPAGQDYTLEAVLAADAEARRYAADYIHHLEMVTS
jgi:1-deoxy-D-xylulose-5-phosphate reductoisomerase